MKKPLETAGFVLAVIGLGGIVHYFFGWFRLWTVLHHLPFLHGTVLLWSNIALVVLGAVLMIASDPVADRTDRADRSHPSLP